MKEITPQKAIEILNPETSREALWKIEYYAGFNAEKARLKAVEDACVVACKALEKQIPKKPLPKDENHIFEACPKCKHYVSDEQNHCEHCGQAIDWSE